MLFDLSEIYLIFKKCTTGKKGKIGEKIQEKNEEVNQVGV